MSTPEDENLNDETQKLYERLIDAESRCAVAKSRLNASQSKLIRIKHLAREAISQMGDRPNGGDMLMACCGNSSYSGEHADGCDYDKFTRYIGRQGE